MSHPHIERKIGALLLIGTLISTMIVLIGGIWYLWQYGDDNMQFELLRSIPEATTVSEVWRVAFSFTPLGIVQLGLLALVGTQLLRVALLFAYYIKIRDLWFSIFCGFVMLVLIYSFL
jgi:uncharacterized membrane protein